jgi:hypothetical protein
MEPRKQIPKEVFDKLQKMYPTLSREGIKTRLKRAKDKKFLLAVKKALAEYEADLKAAKQIKSEIYNGTTITTAVPSSGG